MKRKKVDSKGNQCITKFFKIVDKLGGILKSPVADESSNQKPQPSHSKNIEVKTVLVSDSDTIATPGKACSPTLKSSNNMNRRDYWNIPPQDRHYSQPSREPSFAYRQSRHEFSYLDERQYPRTFSPSNRFDNKNFESKYQEHWQYSSSQGASNSRYKDPRQRYNQYVNRGEVASDLNYRDPWWDRDSWLKERRHHDEGQRCNQSRHNANKQYGLLFDRKDYRPRFNRSGSSSPRVRSERSDRSFNRWSNSPNVGKGQRSAAISSGEQQLPPRTNSEHHKRELFSLSDTKSKNLCENLGDSSCSKRSDVTNRGHTVEISSTCTSTKTLQKSMDTKIKDGSKEDSINVHTKGRVSELVSTEKVADVTSESIKETANGKSNILVSCTEKENAEDDLQSISMSVNEDHKEAGTEEKEDQPNTLSNEKISANEKEFEESKDVPKRSSSIDSYIKPKKRRTQREVSPDVDDISSTSSESDDECLEEFDWITDLDRASTKAVPATPSKSNVSTPETSLTRCMVDCSKTNNKSLKNMFKFSIDEQLAQVAEEDRDKEDGPKDHLDDSGTVDTNNESYSQYANSFLQEHEEKLNALRTEDKSIRDCHPGEVIFKKELFCQLFAPNNVTLKNCKFECRTKLDKRLYSLKGSESVLQFISSGMFSTCMDSLSNQTAVLRWLFLLMSIHPNSHVIEGCTKTLYKILHDSTLKEQAATWFPSLQVILAVFVNYGASFDSLVADASLLSFNEDTLRLNVLKQDALSTPRLHKRLNAEYGIENMNSVIQIIAYAIVQRPSCYSQDDLMSLWYLFCKISLDQRYVDLCNIQICLGALLDRIDDDELLQRVSEMCHNLTSLNIHHHSKVHLVQLLPSTKRGHYIKRRLSYAFLTNLLFDAIEFPPEELKDVKISHLKEVIPILDDSLETDYYKYSSVLYLMDLTIGNEPLQSSEKKELAELLPMIKDVTGKMRDNFSVLDKTRIKNMLVRIRSKWDLIQKGTSRQRTLFAYT